MKQKNAVKRQFKYPKGYIDYEMPVLRQIDALTTNGKPLAQACKEVGITTIKDLYTESEKARTPTTTPFGK